MLVLNREDCELKINPAFADCLEFELHQERMRRSSAGTSIETGADTDTAKSVNDVKEHVVSSEDCASSTPVADPFSGGVIFSFKDPTYSFEEGGYHPVEVCINTFGKLQYVTDFAHVGRPPQVELAKELDFDFEHCCFGHMGIDYPLSDGAELFAIFQANFVSYYQSEVFTVKLSS